MIPAGEAGQIHLAPADRRVHQELANVRTEDEALAFTRSLGVLEVRGPDPLRPGYRLDELMTEAARMRVALSLRRLLSMPRASESEKAAFRQRANGLLDSVDFGSAFRLSPAAWRAHRHFLTERATKRERWTEDVPDEEIKRWQREGVSTDEWRRRVRRMDRQGKPISELVELTKDLLRHLLEFASPSILAGFEEVQGSTAFAAWSVPTLRDYCWLSYLRAGGLELPKVCVCGNWHDRRGEYCSEPCRVRMKARRAYAKKRSAPAPRPE